MGGKLHSSGAYSLYISFPLVSFPGFITFSELVAFHYRTAAKGSFSATWPSPRQRGVHYLLSLTTLNPGPETPLGREPIVTPGPF